MKDIQAFVRHGSGLLHPLSKVGENRIWQVDPQREPVQGSTSSLDRHFSAVFELVEGEELRSFLPETVTLFDVPGFAGKLVTGRHRAAPPHEAYEESVGVAFLENVPNGAYKLSGLGADAPIALNYGLYFRNPPFYPDGDVLCDFDVLSGTLILMNDWEQGVLEGRMRDVVVRVDKIDDQIGIGPDRPYELKIINGRFKVSLSDAGR